VLEHDLGADEQRREPLAVVHAHLPGVRAAPDVQGLSPSRPAANTLAFSSAVVKSWPSRRWRNVPHAATVSANATHTPPCT
jgi:hypothetical protein